MSADKAAAMARLAVLQQEASTILREYPELKKRKRRTRKNLRAGIARKKTAD